MHEEIPMTTMQPPRSIAVCILGMHRSGTSTISRAVNLLGAYLGEDKDIMSPQEDNPEGFWERNDIVAIHDQLLPAFHLRWDTPIPLIEGWHRSSCAEPFCKQLREIVRTSFTGRHLWAWKDPRTCILIDFWKELVAEVDAELVVLFAVRNPLDVAASLMKRNGFSAGKSFGIWFAYNLIALRALRGIRTAFISYDRLLERGEEELRRCSAVLNIAWPDDNADLKRSLDSFLRPDLRHSKSQDADLEGAPIPVQRLFRIITAALERTDPVTDSFFEEIDDLHQEFLGFVELFRADIEARFDDDQTIASLQREMSERDKQQIVNRDHQLQEIRRLLDEKTLELDRYDKEFVEKNVSNIVEEFKVRCLDLIASDVSLKSLKEQNNHLTETNHGLKGFIENKNGELQQINQSLHDLQSRFKDKCHEVIQRDQEINRLVEERTLEQGREARALALKDEQLAKMEMLLKERTEELAEKIRELSARDKLITEKTTVVERLETNIRQIEEEAAQERLRLEEHERLQEERLEKLSCEIEAKRLRLQQQDEALRGQGEELRTLAGVLHMREEKLARIWQEKESERQDYEQHLRQIEEEKEAEKQEYERQLREEEQRIEDIYHSFSWKVTEPLRKTYDLVKGKK